MGPGEILPNYPYSDKHFSTSTLGRGGAVGDRAGDEGESWAWAGAGYEDGSDVKVEVEVED